MTVLVDGITVCGAVLYDSCVGVSCGKAYPANVPMPLIAACMITDNGSLVGLVNTGLVTVFDCSLLVVALTDCIKGARKLGEFRSVGVGTKPFSCCT